MLREVSRSFEKFLEVSRSFEMLREVSRNLGFRQEFLPEAKGG